MMVSEDRLYDDAGVKHLYLWLKDARIAFEVGLKQQKKFWDVYSIGIVTGESLDTVLMSERFIPIK